MVRTLDTSKLLRWTQSLFVIFFGFYPLLVAFGNVTDYNSNFQFVRHVLMMDTTFPGNALMYRAITSPAVHHAVYIFIIALEWIIAFACLYGGFRMLAHVGSDATAFQQSKKWGLIGLLVGLFLWFFGFQVVAGEWFAMWQSKEWNGLSAAFRLTTYIGIALLALMLPSDYEDSSS